MDFIEAKHVAAREIALALGVPPMLLAIPGDNTYSNYQEATRSFWRQTVLPLVTRTAKALSTWLSPAYSAPLELRPDLDAIEALSPEREALWTRIDRATFLTPNEKRATVGYGPVPGGDEVKSLALDGDAVGDLAHKYPGQPRDVLGQFDFGKNPDGFQPASRRRAGHGRGTPAQEARLATVEARAREATRQLRELEPDWQGPQSLTDPEGIEGRIAHQEATAEAAEGRLADILRNAIPDTNPSWGVNRLTKELYDRGYFLETPTDSPGLLYKNPETGEEVRIMERPTSRRYSNDPPEKHTFEHYYRYRPGFGKREGAHVPIPDKN
jgi:hypothetical protein